MVAVGDEMTNAKSGERFVWRATRESTGGAYCEFDLFLSPGAKVAAAHRHPNQEERFTTVTGILKLSKGTESLLLTPGDEQVIPLGTPHQWGNANTEASSHAMVRLTPPLHIEEFFEMFCILAAQGRQGNPGFPATPSRWRHSLTPIGRNSTSPPTRSDDCSAL